jgi:hypothetical protein
MTKELERKGVLPFLNRSELLFHPGSPAQGIEK